MNRIKLASILVIAMFALATITVAASLIYGIIYKQYDHVIMAIMLLVCIVPMMASMVDDLRNNHV